MTMLKHTIEYVGRALRALVADPAPLPPALTEDDVASDRFLRTHPRSKTASRAPAAL